MKKFWTKLAKLVFSKTAWVNLFMFLAIIIPRLVESPAWTLSAETTSTIVLTVNLILRYITKKPLEDK